VRGLSGWLLLVMRGSLGNLGLESSSGESQFPRDACVLLRETRLGRIRCPRFPADQKSGAFAPLPESIQSLPVLSEALVEIEGRQIADAQINLAVSCCRFSDLLNGGQQQRDSSHR